MLAHSGSGSDFSSMAGGNMGSGGGEYAHLPPHYQQQMREQHQRWTPHPTPQQLQHNQQQQQYQHHQQQQYAGSMPGGGNGTMRLSNSSQRFAAGSAPAGSAMDQAAAIRQNQQQQQYQQQGQQQGQYQGGSYSSVPSRVASPSQRRSFGSGTSAFATAQQPPAQGFSSGGGYATAEQQGSGNADAGRVLSARSSASFSDDIRSGAGEQSASCGG
jgi:hypothetical protein